MTGKVKLKTRTRTGRDWCVSVHCGVLPGLGDTEIKQEREQQKCHILYYTVCVVVCVCLCVCVKQGSNNQYIQPQKHGRSAFSVISSKRHL